jgi:uncharacterized protein (DUF1778 family)/GNAT superfamily N-acetyltransferase
MSTTIQTRETTINLRARTRQRELIDQAAELQGKTRSEFMLEAACEKAQNVLIDQTSFVLDQRRFKRFLDLLDQPIEKNKALAKLLASRSPWDK